MDATRQRLYGHALQQQARVLRAEQRTLRRIADSFEERADNLDHVAYRLLEAEDDGSSIQVVMPDGSEHTLAIVGTPVADNGVTPELRELLDLAEEASNGFSNDAEIDALRAALNLAVNLLGGQS